MESSPITVPKCHLHLITRFGLQCARPTVVSLLHKLTFKSNNKSTAASSPRKYFLIRPDNPLLTTDFTLRQITFQRRQLLLVAAELSWLRRVSIHYCCETLIKAFLLSPPLRGQVFFSSSAPSWMEMALLLARRPANHLISVAPPLTSVGSEPTYS